MYRTHLALASTSFDYHFQLLPERHVQKCLLALARAASALQMHALDCARPAPQLLVAALLLQLCQVKL